MMLQLSGVHAHYGHIHALKGIDVDVQVGEIVTLIGANGAGKSTLLMSLFGQPRASGGRIIFDGEDITKLPTHAISRRGISLVPEGRRIFQRMTVMENLQNVYCFFRRRMLLSTNSSSKIKGKITNLLKRKEKLYMTMIYAD